MDFPAGGPGWMYPFCFLAYGYSNVQQHPQPDRMDPVHHFCNWLHHLQHGQLLGNVRKYLFPSCVPCVPHPLFPQRCQLRCFEPVSDTAG